MRYLLVSAAAVMAITGAAALGNAQMQDKEKDKRPAAEPNGPPPSGGAERSPGGGATSIPPIAASRSPNRAEVRSVSLAVTRQPRPRSRTNRKEYKSATQPQRDQDKQKSTEQQRQRDQDKQKSTDQQRSAITTSRSPPSSSASAITTSRSPPTAAPARPGQAEVHRQRQRDQDKQKSTKGPDDKQAGRVQVSEEKRSGVRERLVKERGVDRVQRSRINVSINIGTALPRSVRLHRFPTTVVSFEPAYRGYSYVLLDDETIVIVDERTYVIVDVIPAGTQRADRPGRAHLTLSADDMRYIYRTAPKSRIANVRVRLALGAEVPRDVELLAFPDEIVERVPDMRRYRYIVTEGDIVVVDPDDHAVALVINE